jgi:hypothetical protein
MAPIQFDDTDDPIDICYDNGLCAIFGQNFVRKYSKYTFSYNWLLFNNTIR